MTHQEHSKSVANAVPCTATMMTFGALSQLWVAGRLVADAARLAETTMSKIKRQS